MSWEAGKSWTAPGMQGGSAVSTLQFIIHTKRQYIRPMFSRLLIPVIHGYVKTLTPILKLLFTLIHAKEALKTETEAGYSATTIWVYTWGEILQWNYWDCYQFWPVGIWFSIFPLLWSRTPQMSLSGKPEGSVGVKNGVCAASMVVVYSCALSLGPLMLLSVSHFF